MESTESTPKKLEDNPKDALEAYLRYMWKGYYKWYEKAVKQNQQLWLALQLVSIISAIATAVLAGLSGEKWFRDYESLRIAMIVIPLIGTFASSIAANTKVASLWALREQGRQAVQALVDSGRQRFAAATSAADYVAIHQFLVKAIEKVEASQAEGCFPLLPEIPGSPAQTQLPLPSKTVGS
ncbi:hypothetical protein Psta_0887 [Pirellula staleyi DSM 6068]|uniref:SMODS and SLOG-associating 2TM effector domain-containing protein n=1 Tax=Pirellula staleyi (strain ATCC 27377 / DSM 6068 / ICPB 4128) TaxID=530564 RepID=D2R776_PIRSD|nr:hypothetical protein [Pirellula staleyi]ADB15572.1 hypothetical protein Psta_0887 [Pirellula staleyi DSM 6068]